MIGVLIIAHGNLGDALIGCMTHVLGRRPEAVASLSVAANDSPRDLIPVAKTMIESLDDGDGVLIITDIFGASPANLAAKMICTGHVEAVTGGNVPMLVRAMTYRTKGMETLLKRVVAGGCEGVFHIEADPIIGPCVAKSQANEGAPALTRH
jgi:mannose PTS system EIIA component